MQRHAVVIGINSYLGAPLRGCVDDAEEMAECLALEQYGFDCVSLLDERATRANILEAIGALAYADGDRDALLIYFAGHGQSLGQHGHLVTYDGTQYDPGISLAHLGQLMESASTGYRHVISILDCCHSGAAITWANSRPLHSGDVAREIRSVNESRCILAACRPEEAAIEIGARGVFTSALVDGMLGNAVDYAGNVSLFALHDYAVRVIPEDVQTPVFKGDAAGAVLLGTGLPPLKGPPIERSELDKTLTKAQSLIDEYYYLQQSQTSDRDHRLREGAATCAQHLGPIVEWFRATEVSLADLGRNPEWLDLQARLHEFQANLAATSIGQTTAFGRVVRHLGHGGYGHVWEIDDPVGKKVAFKIFHGNELDDAVKVQRFSNGYRNMKKLDHPRIVRVLDIVDAPYGFTMDAIQGENLRSAYLDRSDSATCIRLLLEIAETIQHAHSRGVRHRDIKPENIIVVYGDSGSLIPYLTDFDLAYHETNRTVTTNFGVGGVISYAAPEQLYAPNAASARSETVDVYSLAQLMFFVVVGRDPSGDEFDKNRDLLLRSLNDWVEARAAAQLLDFYSRATDKDPSVRPQSISDAARYLISAETFVLAMSGRDDVDSDDFCRRLGHAYAGLQNFQATEGEARMFSLSRQVEIVIRNKGVTSKNSGALNLEFELVVTGDIPVSAMNTGHAGRQSVNTRLDKLLRRYTGVRRHPGNHGVFQTYIEVPAVPLTLEGLTRANEILTGVVAGIEAW